MVLDSDIVFVDNSLENIAILHLGFYSINILNSLPPLMTNIYLLKCTFFYVLVIIVKIQR